MLAALPKESMDGSREMLPTSHPSFNTSTMQRVTAAEGKRVLNGGRKPLPSASAPIPQSKPDWYFMYTVLPQAVRQREREREVSMKLMQTPSILRRFFNLTPVMIGVVETLDSVAVFRHGPPMSPHPCLH
ncbi:hypothetical protein XA68_14193 [Ophiocordyceps unilateralis]|uniref:Uncharacterized protein n=1 Tax=Ophiocordyceps unilateralis TaxID=268505 RepID=A0A2A9PAQ6_OPHUN|nr:hypothetical protein XA68_14193 [Ophiocordyceps unilateralis]